MVGFSKTAGISSGSHRIIRRAKSAFCNGTFAFGLHSGQVNLINLE